LEVAPAGCGYYNEQNYYSYEQLKNIKIGAALLRNVGGIILQLKLKMGDGTCAVFYFDAVAQQAVDVLVDVIEDATLVASRRSTGQEIRETISRQLGLLLPAITFFLIYDI
jgi:hypothetical protein